jgi:hypothetical protein
MLDTRKRRTTRSANPRVAEAAPARISGLTVLLAAGIVAVFVGGVTVTVSLLDSKPKAAPSASSKATRSSSTDHREAEATERTRERQVTSLPQNRAAAPPSATTEPPSPQPNVDLATADAMTLGRLAASDMNARRALLRMLQDENADRRLQALDAVEALRDPSLIDEVMPLLEDDVSVRRMALGTLSELATKGNNPVVTQEVTERVKELVEDSDPTVRNEAIAVLGDLKDKSALPQMIRSLGDADLAVRGMTLTSLAKLGDPAALPHVRQVYEQGDPRLAADAAMAMKRLGDEGPWRTESARLSQAIQSGDPTTREQALRELNRVSQM